MGLTHALSEELQSFGIKVIALLPDATDTPLIDGADATAPFGKMSPRVVADLMIQLILQPDDTRWIDPLIAPFAASAATPVQPARTCP